MPKSLDPDATSRYGIWINNTALRVKKVIMCRYRYLIVHELAEGTEVLLGHHLAQVDDATVAPHGGNKLKLLATLGTGRPGIAVVPMDHQDVLLEVGGVDEAAAGAVVAELAGKPPDTLVHTAATNDQCFL